ncbi:MAG: hypothetical protein ACOC1P_00565 [Minisyncoccales bacterium]
MSFNQSYVQTRENASDFFTGRDLLNKLAGDFSRCNNESERREYKKDINENKEVISALGIFNNFHTTQQDILYGEKTAELVRYLRDTESL